MHHLRTAEVPNQGVSRNDAEGLGAVILVAGSAAEVLIGCFHATYNPLDSIIVYLHQVSLSATRNVDRFLNGSS